MSRRTIVGAATLIVALIAVWFYLHNRASSEYSALRRQLQEHHFDFEPLNDTTVGYLSEIESNWEMVDEEAPSSIVSKVSEILDVPSSTKSLLDLYRYEMPPYSLTDRDGNGEAVVTAQTKMTFAAFLIDNTLYYNDDTVVVRPHRLRVEVYRDSGQGLEWRRYQPRPSEQDAAPQIRPRWRVGH